MLRVGCSLVPQSWVLDGVLHESGVLFGGLWLSPGGVTGVSSALRSVWLGCGRAGLQRRRHA